MSDALDRVPLVLSTVVKCAEYEQAIIQLVEFLPPSKSPLPLTEVLKKIREFIRRVVLTGNITINLLLFEIQVKVTAGHSIEIYIRRVLNVSGTPVYEDAQDKKWDIVYIGEWR